MTAEENVTNFVFVCGSEQTELKDMLKGQV